MRAESLHVQGHSFQEIAKIVGAHWQVLPKEEKDRFLDEAKNMKLVWDRHMAEYRETPQHAEYQAYLKDFKEKHRPPHAQSSSTDGHYDESSTAENIDDGYTITSGYGSSDRSETTHSRKPSLHVLPPMQSPSSDRSPVTIASLPSAGAQKVLAYVGQGRDHRPLLAAAPEVDRSTLNGHMRLDRQLPLPVPTFRQ
ncbi:hypothetical protein MRB53_040154 [Persea americana]|nr:hypothetical protein MRB53_040154 [Persea americana]